MKKIIRFSKVSVYEKLGELGKADPKLLPLAKDDGHILSPYPIEFK